MKGGGSELTGASGSLLVVDVAFWASLFLGTALLLFCMVYALVLFGDLSRDHINPVELCDLVNRTVYWEYVGQAALGVLLLLRGYFVCAALHAPLTAFHVVRVKAGDALLDNTQIFSHLPKVQRVTEVKLAFYLFAFFVDLYLFIRYLIT
jgi:protein cornichon